MSASGSDCPKSLRGRGPRGRVTGRVPLLLDERASVAATAAVRLTSRLRGSA